MTASFEEASTASFDAVPSAWTYFGTSFFGFAPGCAEELSEAEAELFDADAASAPALFFLSFLTTVFPFRGAFVPGPFREAFLREEDPPIATDSAAAASTPSEDEAAEGGTPSDTRGDWATDDPADCAAFFTVEAGFVDAAPLPPFPLFAVFGGGVLPPIAMAIAAAASAFDSERRGGLRAAEASTASTRRAILSYADDLQMSGKTRCCQHLRNNSIVVLTNARPRLLRPRGPKGPALGAKKNLFDNEKTTTSFGNSTTGLFCMKMSQNANHDDDLSIRDPGSVEKLKLYRNISS